MRPMDMRSADGANPERGPGTWAARTARVTAGALAIAAPASAVALAAGQADAQSADAQSAFQLQRVAKHFKYGQTLSLAGVAPAGDSGQKLALEFSTGRSAWGTIAYAKVHSDGAFRLRAPLTRSGNVRVAAITAAPTGALKAGVVAVTGEPAATSAGTTASQAIVASEPQPVAVAAKLLAPTGAIEALGNQRLALRGALLPRHAGRVVRLQGRRRGTWRTLAVTHTRASGRFVLHYVPRTDGRQAVRVSFGGDSGNGAVHTRAREVIQLQPALSSWYYDAGNTACGFHAADGIANKYLPCGTRVTISYHGRTVTAVVDDRGPFVPGREYDLSQTTAGALGFGGVDTVWSAVEPPVAKSRHHARPGRRHRRKPSTRRHPAPSGRRRSLAA